MQLLNILKKFRLILSHHQKFRIIQLLILMIIGGLLETFSISLIVPFMEVITNPEKMMGKWYIRNFCSLFHIQSSTIFILVVALLLVLLYILKNIYLMFQSNIQYHFVYNNMFATQCKLLETLINRPYEYFLSISSGEVIRIINSNPVEAFMLLVTLLSMFTELVVSSMLLMAIFIMAPMATLIIAVLLSSLLLFVNFFLRPIIRRASLSLQKSATGMNTWLLQAIQGIKELKVLNKEAFFLRNYEVNGQAYINSWRKYQILQITPRYLIEAVCMSALFLAVAIMIILGTELETVIPILSAIAMATIRLLPSMTRISGALTQIAYGEPILDRMIEHIKITQTASQHSTTTARTDNNSKHTVQEKNLLSLQNITFSYPNSSKEVLSHADFHIKSGETIGIVGASGAGKTTLADIILGLLTPREGRFFLQDQDITDNIASLHSSIGYIPQSIFMLDDTIAANIAFGVPKEQISTELLERVVKEAALEGFIKELPEGLNTEIGERGVRLSGGQRQRIGIARALYREPNILILDEATSALDNETEEAIMESINHLKGKKTMIIIAHRLSTIENCDHVYRVQDGKIIKER